MQKVQCVIPTELRVKIRRAKEYLNSTVRQEMALHQAEYDNFVTRVEGTPSWKYKGEPVGIVEIKELLVRCIPDKYMEDYTKDLNNYLADPDFRHYCIDVIAEQMRIDDDIHINKETVTIESLANTDSKGLMEIFLMLGKEMYIAKAMFDMTFVSNFYHLVADRDPLAVYTYYYLVFDHGYMKIARLLQKLMLTEESGYRHLTTFYYLVTALVSCSTSFGSEDKKSWGEFAESIADESEELWKEITSTLRYVIDNKGQKKTQQITLSEMLIGDKEELLLGIEQFLRENEESITLAYLLRALERTYHIDCPSFRVFCNAVNLHFGKNIGFRKGLDRYNEINKCPTSLQEPRGKSWIKAKETIDTWAEIFSNCA